GAADATREAPLAAAPPFGSFVNAAADHGNAGTGVADSQLPVPDLGTGLGASSGGSGGGFSPTFFLVLLSALVCLARLLYERLRLPSFSWRPVAFVSLLERPG